MATDTRATVNVLTDSPQSFLAEITIEGLPGPVQLTQNRNMKGAMYLKLPANGVLPVGGIDAYAEAILTALATAAVHDARVPIEQRPQEVFVKFDVSFWNPDGRESASAAETASPASKVAHLLPILYTMLADAVTAVRDVEQMTAELLTLPLPAKHALRVAAVEGILTTARRAVQLAITMLEVRGAEVSAKPPTPVPPRPSPA